MSETDLFPTFNMSTFPKQAQDMLNAQAEYIKILEYALEGVHAIETDLFRIDPFFDDATPDDWRLIIHDDVVEPELHPDPEWFNSPVLALKRYYEVQLALDREADK